MADHNKPVLTSTYTNFVSELDARFDDLAVGLDPALTTATNVPVGTLRWNSALNKDQKWDGSAWIDKTSTEVFNSIYSNGTITTSGQLAGAGFGLNLAPISSNGTTQSFAVVRNTGGDFFFGKEGSVSGGYFTGSSAYDDVIYTSSGLNIIVGGAKRAVVSSTGLSVTGTLSVGRVGIPLVVKDNGGTDYGNDLYLPHDGGSSTQRAFRIRSSYNGGVGQLQIAQSTNSSAQFTDPTSLTYANRLVLDSAGVSVSGTLSASSAIKAGSGSATPTAQLSNVTPSGTEASLELYQTGVESWKLKNPASSTDLILAQSGVSRVSWNGTTGLMNVGAGLAITGTLSATGSPIFNNSSTSSNILTMQNSGQSLYVGVLPSSGSFWNQLSPAYSGTIGTSGNTPLVFATNSNVVATLDSTGLAVTGEVKTNGANTQIVQGELDSGTTFIQSKNSGGTPKALSFWGAYEYGRFDAAGNFGLGVTPGAWRAVDKALQVRSTIIENVNNTAAVFGLNYYRDSGGIDRYINSDRSAQIVLNNGGVGNIAFNTAPSGTAGNPITFTQAMTLEAGGGLLIGRSSMVSGSASYATIIADGNTRFGITVANKSATNSTFLSFANNSDAIIGSISQNGTGITVSGGTKLNLAGTTVTAPTAASTDNSTSVATTAYVRSTATVQSGTALNTTSGTSFDFTSIPSGVKRINIMLSEVLRTGTSLFVLRLGTSGGFETTGYKGNGTQLIDASSVNVATETTGFQIRSAIAVNDLNGVITLVNISGDKWVVSGALSSSVAGYTFLTNGSKLLSAPLTQVRFTTINGTDTFTAGLINISYEF